MKRVAFTLLAAALLAACAELPPGDYALVPLDGQPVTPGEYTYDGAQGRYRVEVRSAMAVTMAPEATRTPTVTPNAPEPSVTPSPSRTPVLAPSATSTPTATVTASPTSTATATPSGILTPTPEGPTATPGPSSTASVEPKPALCEGVVINQAGLNVRAAPSTNAAVVGTLSGDAVAVIDRFYIVSDDREEWAHLTSPVNGWVAAVFYNGRRLLAWPEDVTDGERAIWCLPPYVTVEWASNPPPTPPITRGVGWTLTFGYDAAALSRAAEILKADGLVPSVTLTSNAGEACRFAQQGYLVNIRPWYALGLSDHPDLALPPEQSARARIEALSGYASILCASSRNVAVQLSNETSWPDAAYLNRWILEAVRQCDARSWRCLPAAFSTGTPEETWMPALRPALDAMASGGHYFGYNAYPFQRDLMLCDAAQEWMTWRVIRLKRAAGGPFPRVWVTEAARGAGDVQPIVSDTRCYVERAFEWRAADVINLWYAGGDSAWSGARWSGERMIELAWALAGSRSDVASTGDQAKKCEELRRVLAALCLSQNMSRI